jgi:hypothetical protein
MLRRPAIGLLGQMLGFDDAKPGTRVVRLGPAMAIMGPVVAIELGRVEALELLGMTLAHLSVVEARTEMSPRVPMLMAIRDKLARALEEEQ